MTEAPSFNHIGAVDDRVRVLERRVSLLEARCDETPKSLYVGEIGMEIFTPGAETSSSFPARPPWSSILRSSRCWLHSLFASKRSRQDRR